MSYFVQLKWFICSYHNLFGLMNQEQMTIIGIPWFWKVCLRPLHFYRRHVFLYGFLFSLTKKKSEEIFSFCLKRQKDKLALHLCFAVSCCRGSAHSKHPTKLLSWVRHSTSQHQAAWTSHEPWTSHEHLCFVTVYLVLHQHHVLQYGNCFFTLLLFWLNESFHRNSLLSHRDVNLYLNLVFALG